MASFQSSGTTLAYTNPRTNSRFKPVSKDNLNHSYQSSFQPQGGRGAFCQSATAKPNYTKKSYIDDLTLLEKISLSDLIQKKRIIGPLDFHDRFNLELPPSKAILQHQVEDLTSFTTKQSMVLNTKKTKCMPFNNSQTKDFCQH